MGVYGDRYRLWAANGCAWTLAMRTFLGGNMVQFVDKSYVALRDIPRQYKNLILFSLDASLVPICLYLAFALRLDSIAPHAGQGGFWLLILLQTIAGIATLLIVGQHKTKLHNFDINSLFRISVTAIVLFFALVFLLYLFRLWAPRSVPIIFAVLFFVASAGIRTFISALLNYANRRLNNAIPVGIYGTSNTAIQVLFALKASSSHEPLCFFDDNSALHGATIANIKVESSTNIEKALKKKGIQEVYIALPDASQEAIKPIASRLTELGIKCHITPTVTELLLNNSRDILREGVSFEDLLGREKFDLLSEELQSGFQGKVVIVTGAGGSIGSELCRQILHFKPKKLILFEINEFALYTITTELAVQAAEQKTELVPKLGSVLDRKCLETVLKHDRANVLFHAAAYKHVPLVEQNILEAANNNVLGTYTAASVAGKMLVDKFVLISTDKAVRPTNIMGATKRLAELVATSCQEKYPATRYSVVRFGNVLGSSGSVIPLFKKQIEQGGPVTVTHPNITRYFMTIPEASKLVLIAGFFSDGGDTFVLDMGKPVKIMDLARRIIELSGFTVKDDGNPDGDIAIDFVGLRPGEKMFEELFFQKDEMVDTPHNKIFRAKEKTVSESDADKILRCVSCSISEGDSASFIRLITENVEGFRWNTDHSQPS